jgi:hypothetical protein
MILALLAALAVADPADGDASDVTTETTTTAASQPTGGTTEQRAEYFRLSQELQKLATRNAWAGVEHTYEQLLATGVTPTFDDYLCGANAAKALGDVTAARSRLLAANAIKEDREVLDWLWDIDSNYGPVSVMGDPTKVALKADSVPFDPNQAKAVDFAVAEVTATGTFEGYLPQGTYHFVDSTTPGGDHAVKVQPRVQATRIDLRSDEYMQKLEKEQKEAKKAAGKKPK